MALAVVGVAPAASGAATQAKGRECRPPKATQPMTGTPRRLVHRGYPRCRGYPRKTRKNHICKERRSDELADPGVNEDEQELPVVRPQEPVLRGDIGIAGQVGLPRGAVGVPTGQPVVELPEK
jgi:hypothetical protein